MSKVDDLEKLAVLKEKGFLTQQEFDAQKKEILNGSKKEHLTKKKTKHPANATGRTRTRKVEWTEADQKATEEARKRYDAFQKELKERRLAKEANRTGIIRKVADTAALGFLGMFAADKMKKYLKD